MSKQDVLKRAYYLGKQSAYFLRKSTRDIAMSNSYVNQMYDLKRTYNIWAIDIQAEYEKGYKS